MAFETWAAFAVASVALLLIPGPTTLLVIGRSLGAGRRGASWRAVLRDARPLVAGVALGDLTAMTLSLAGLGTLLAASATLFTLLKWAGAAYLVWLGVTLWRAPVAAGAAPPPGARRAMRDAYLVTALNPKGIAFFVAFVPQFLDPGLPFLPQAALLAATFVGLAALNATAYALLAGRLSGAVTRPAVRRGLNRAGGAMLVGAGLATATMRRA